MIHFIQSYAAPKSIENSEIFADLKRFLGEDSKIRVVSLFAPRARGLTCRESLKLSIQTIYKAKSNDLIFSWGGGIVELSQKLSHGFRLGSVLYCHRI